MRPIPLAAALALLGASGCVVRHYYPDTGVTYREVQYRYYGAHPIPEAVGDGWCLVEHDHVHEYMPERTHYVYRGGVYVYARPTVVWYVGYHPIPSGGYCGLHGRHSHDYHPGSALAPQYTWDRSQRVYVYRNAPPHDARRVDMVPPPPPGRPYGPPPSYAPPPPPPGHGGIPPGQGGTPPGHGYGGPPPGHVYNPGHGDAVPPGQAESAPGFRVPPPVQPGNPGRGNDDRDHGRGQGQGNDDRGETARGVRPGPMNVHPAGGNSGQPQKRDGKGKDEKDKDDNRPRPTPPGRGR